VEYSFKETDLRQTHSLEGHVDHPETARQSHVHKKREYVILLYVAFHELNHIIHNDFSQKKEAVTLVTAS
jgi:hypothetical protein